MNNDEYIKFLEERTKIYNDFVFSLKRMIDETIEQIAEIESGLICGK